MKTIEILNRAYPVIGHIKVQGISGCIPLLNIRMMSEEREKELGAQSAAAWKKVAQS